MTHDAATTTAAIREACRRIGIGPIRARAEVSRFSRGLNLSGDVAPGVADILRRYEAASPSDRAVMREAWASEWDAYVGEVAR